VKLHWGSYYSRDVPRCKINTLPVRIRHHVLKSSAEDWGIDKGIPSRLVKLLATTLFSGLNDFLYDGQKPSFLAWLLPCRFIKGFIIK
jgi:hypothetical protein